MEHTNLDISVLLLFFSRPDHFGRVWEEVKKARPARLFLYQDGPRMVDADGRQVATAQQSKDWQGIMECRSMVADEQIDWPCEVHRLYQERNYGCDPSGFMSHRWAFAQTDKCIVLEDDVVPSQSFFRFCKEMLDRYEHDRRVTMVAGFNTDEQTTDVPDGADYFFTRAFSIWGWASWARVVNEWDGEYGFVHDKQTFDTLCNKVAKYRQRADMPQMCQDHAASGKHYFESIFWSYMLLNDGLAVMPRVNMINNVGLDGGTHYSAQLNLLPHRLRRQFTMGRHELDFPLHHPSEVGELTAYQKRYYLMNAWNNPWRKVQYSVEELWLNLRSGKMKKIGQALKSRLLKTLGRKKHH
ncbi:MAG: hemolysin activation protein [Bacteroidales bacterium]|nr:hemolysin activation protein [Candidatus Physcousia equi]